jgi:hypothetical protein
MMKQTSLISSIVHGGGKRRSRMADCFHLIGKRFSPTMGDHAPKGIFFVAERNR